MLQFSAEGRHHRFNDNCQETEPQKKNDAKCSRILAEVHEDGVRRRPARQEGAWRSDLVDVALLKIEV
eukprot:3987369-Heterocapsa_arctica.AAC.1